jgi:transposase-like protein
MFNGPTVQEFFKQFPDDDTCLEYLMQLRHGETLDCPKCGKHGKFHRIKRHPAYECAWCGFEIYPMVGTMFHRSHTPLQKWFYALYLFTTTRHGVPAKELQRQLGVSYPTALRMSHEIRKHMGDADGTPPLTGHVEVDETYVGGRRPKIKGFTGRSAKGKTVVFGILERGGELYTSVVPRALSDHLES